MLGIAPARAALRWRLLSSLAAQNAPWAQALASASPAGVGRLLAVKEDVAEERMLYCLAYGLQVGRYGRGRGWSVVQSMCVRSKL